MLEALSPLLPWLTLAAASFVTPEDRAANAAAAAPAAVEESAMSRDVHSFSRPDQVRVRHLELDLEADFDARVLRGSAAFTLERVAPGASLLVLDTDHLRIDAVADADGGPLDFLLRERDPVLGSALEIVLREGVGRVVVSYATSPGAAALQWLEPRQTSGDRPFLFTQGQSILTRTWFPCQDTPGVRFTFDARIRVPDDLRAVMSAEMLSGAGDPAGDARAFRFRMPHPVPSYLVALAVGRLEFAAIGARTGVYAEPEVVEAAAWEFADTERMVEAAERLYGPYRWGRYDILVLPASFPFGGMENPCLTFATPTIIAGDRSLTALVAHELAHSWSGNLVTNAEWADLWLNEGFTVYFEGRIMESVYGEEYFHMLAVLGWQDLQNDLRELGHDHGDTRLRPELAGRNPDDAFSNVPYEKGALFLRTIERHVGRARFDEFLRDYFERYAFQAMNTARFVAHLEATLFQDDADGLDAIRPQQWIHAPGLPDNAHEPTSDLLQQVDAARARFLESGDAASIDAARFTTHHWLYLLRGMPQRMSAAHLAALDDAFGLTRTGNREKLFEWLRIAIRNRYEPALPALRTFLVEVGRRKFLKPLYQDLVASDWGRAFAREVYAEARPGYHSVSYRTIDEIIEKARG